MNWRSGFKRLEIVYAAFALLVIVYTAIAAGGDDVIIQPGIERILRPQDEWVLHYPQAPETTTLLVPHGVTAEWVREKASKLTEWRSGCSVTFGRSLAFNIAGAGRAAMAWALGFFGAWAAFKLLLWVLRGFRSKA